MGEGKKKGKNQDQGNPDACGRGVVGQRRCGFNARLFLSVWRNAWVAFNVGMETVRQPKEKEQAQTTTLFMHENHVR